MLAKYISMNVLLRHFKVLGKSAAQTSRIQQRTGTYNLVLRNSGNLCKHISHDVYRVAYDYVKCIWCNGYDLRCDGFQDINICLCKLNSCLARFPCDT